MIRLYVWFVLALCLREIALPTVLVARTAGVLGVMEKMILGWLEAPIYGQPRRPGDDQPTVLVLLAATLVP